MRILIHQSSVGVFFIFLVFLLLPIHLSAAEHNLEPNIQPNSKIAGEIFSSGQVDIYKINVNSPGIVSISSESTIVKFQLVDSAGIEIASGKKILKKLPIGIYHLNISHADQNKTGKYLYTYQLFSPEHIHAGTFIQGKFTDDFERHFYQIAFDTAGIMKIENFSRFDSFYNITAYNENMHQLPVTDGNSIPGLFVQTGTYFIEINPKSNHASNTEFYKMGITFQASSNSPDDHGNSFAQSTKITVGNTYTFEQSFDDDTDVFQFNLKDKSIVEITAKGIYKPT